MEAEALKEIIKNNARFYFIFDYHTLNEKIFQDLLLPAAEALSLQDARAFFYYHLHENFPELGRGAIIQLIDQHPVSYFEYGLDAVYPDYLNSANNARNILLNRNKSEVGKIASISDQIYIYLKGK